MLLKEFFAPPVQAPEPLAHSTLPDPEADHFYDLSLSILEARVAGLKPGESISVDAKGRIAIEVSGVRVENSGHPELTFRRIAPDQLQMVAGRPSLVPVQVVGKEGNGPRLLQASEVLRSGMMVGWDGFMIALFSSWPRGGFSANQIEVQAARVIFELRIGERFVVSKGGNHITFERLSPWLDETERRYRVTPGIPAKQGAHLLKSDCEERVRDWLDIEPGMQVRLGASKFRVFTVPKRNWIPQVKTKRVDITSVAETVVAAPPQVVALFARNSHLDLRKLTVLPQYASALGMHIAEGLSLIRRGQYLDSQVHFASSDTLESYGFEQEAKNLKRLSAGCADELLASVLECETTGGRKLSGFNLDKEKSLILAEQWLLAYRKALGRNISKKGVFITGEFAAQQDVTQFLREQQIPLSVAFSLRGFRRLETLITLEGIQTKAQSEKFEKILSALAPGQVVRVGRGADCELKIEKPDIQDYVDSHQLCRYLQGDQTPEMLLDLAIPQISRWHCTIEKLSNGKYRISDGNGSKPSGNGIFIADHCEILRRIQGNLEVSANATIWLGRSFALRFAKFAQVETTKETPA